MFTFSDCPLDSIEGPFGLRLQLLLEYVFEPIVIFVIFSYQNYGRQAEHVLMNAIGQNSFALGLLKRVQKNFADTFVVESGIAMNEVN